MTKEHREEYTKLHHDAGALLTLCANEKRNQTGEENTAQEARYSRMDVLRTQAEDEKRQAGYAFAAGKTDPVNGGKSLAQLEIEAGGEGGGSPTAMTAATFNSKRAMSDAEKQKYRDAANNYLRTGEVDKFTITTTGNSILVPTAVMPPEAIRRNMNAFRAVLGATGYTVMETTGTEVIVLPIFDDTGNTGDTPAEGATTANTADVSTTGSVTLASTLYSSKQRWFSNTLLNANGFDILTYITPILQKSVDKTEEAAWTNRLAAMTAPTFINAHDGALSYIELLNWEHTLNVAYRSDAAFILADSLYRIIRGLVDSNNRPIMDLDPTNVFQTRIHNKPAFVSDYLTAMGTASSVTGAFLSGDAIKMRAVIPQRLTRYVNVPQYTDQTGYQLFENADCQFVPNGVALLKTASAA